MKVYDRDMQGQSANSLIKIKSLISKGEMVLDIGCGTGALGEALKRDLGTRVIGIEYNIDSVKAASQKLDQVYQLDLNQEQLSDVLDEKFDVIVLADILEHVYQPERLLQQAKKQLAENGRLLISIPNAGYIGAILSLYNDEWDYGEEGILDTTHVRFYTKKSILKLLNQNGFDAAIVDRVRKDLVETEFKVRIDPLVPALRDWLLAKDEGSTYQFIIEARPAEQKSSLAEIEIAASPSVELSFLTKLYYSEQLGDYSEERTVFQHGAMGEDNEMSYLLNVSNLQSIRFCFADRRSRYDIYKVEIYSNDKLLFRSDHDRCKLSFEGVNLLTESFPLYLFAKDEKAYVEMQFLQSISGDNLKALVFMRAPISEGNLSFCSAISETAYAATLSEMKKSMLLYADAVRYNEALEINLSNAKAYAKDLAENSARNLAEIKQAQQAEVLLLESQISGLKEEQLQLYESLSWRITAPLRKLKQMLTK